MKTILTTAAIVLGASLPAAAASQLEMQLGVTPGVYSTADLVALKFASEETGNQARVQLGEDSGMVVSSSNVQNSRAAEIFAEIARESDDGIQRVFADNPVVTTYGSSAVNARAEAIFEAIDSAEQGND